MRIHSPEHKVLERRRRKIHSKTETDVQRRNEQKKKLEMKEDEKNSQPKLFPTLKLPIGKWFECLPNTGKRQANEVSADDRETKKSNKKSVSKTRTKVLFKQNNCQAQVKCKDENRTKEKKTKMNYTYKMLSKKLP